MTKAVIIRTGTFGCHDSIVCSRGHVSEADTTLISCSNSLAHYHDTTLRSKLLGCGNPSCVWLVCCMPNHRLEILMRRSSSRRSPTRPRLAPQSQRRAKPQRTATVARRLSRERAAQWCAFSCTPAPLPHAVPRLLQTACLVLRLDSTIVAVGCFACAVL